MKLKIGFDIDSWDKRDYRILIEDFSRDSSEIDLYLLTTSTDSDLINEISTLFNIATDHVISCTDNDALVIALDTNKILLYLTAQQDLVRLINLEIPLITSSNNVTGCEAILVNTIPDTNKLQPKYVTYLQFWINQISKWTSG